METADNTTPDAVIKQKRDSVSVTLSELSAQDAKSFNITRTNSSNIHNKNREGIYSDSDNSVDIVDPLRQGISNPLSIKNTVDIFGHPRTWAESLADESLLSGASNNVYHLHSVTAGESSVQEGIDTTLESMSPNNPNTNTGSVKFVNATMELLQTQMKREEEPKKKRTRTTSDQLRILQKAFNIDPMPSATARIALAKKLGMIPRAVQVWFQNRRAKGKLDQKRSEIVASTVDKTNSNTSNDNLAFIKGSSTSFMHPIQPSNQSNVHSLNTMLLGTTNAPILCQEMNTSDTVSHLNIFANLPRSIAPIYMGSKSQPIDNVNSTDTSWYNNTSISGYKHASKSQDQLASTMNMKPSVDDKYTNDLTINNEQLVISDCMNTTDNNCYMSTEHISQHSNVDRCNSVPFYRLDNSFIPPQEYSTRTRASIPYYSYSNNDLMLSQPVGLGLENMNDIENMNAINSYHSQPYSVDYSMAHKYLLQSQENAYAYNNALSKSYFQHFQYPNTTVNFDSIDGSKYDRTSEQGSKMNHNDQRTFIQMADITPPSVEGWQQIPAGIHSNTNNSAFGRSYSLPSQSGSTMMPGSLNHQNLLCPPHGNQMANTNHVPSTMNWPQEMFTRSISSNFDDRPQFCYSKLAHNSDQHIESKNSISNTKQFNNSKIGINTSEQTLVPINDMIINNSCDVIDNNSFSIDEKRGKRSTSTPSISPIHTNVKTHLSGISKSCPETNLSWDKTFTSIDASKQCQQESSITDISGPMTPEELVNHRRMSRSSFSTLQSEKSIDLSKYVQLDPSLVLPVGLYDLMTEELDLSASGYQQNGFKVDYQ